MARPLLYPGQGDTKLLRNLPAAASLILLAAFAVNAAEPNFDAWSDQQKEEFLRSADVGRLKTLKRGVTKSQSATLAVEGVSHQAHFQSVDEYKPIFVTERGTEMQFRDSYKFNIAAYRLDRLIGLNLVPVSVERRTSRKDGALTWWIDGVQMTERERRKKKATPPNLADWNDQMLNLRVFNELTYNVDANLGNIVVTHDWLPRPVDFTRAFRLHHDLRNPANLAKIDRRVYEGLKGLTKAALLDGMGDLLSEEAIDALLARRDTIIAFFDQKIAERGESAAICSRPGH